MRFRKLDSIFTLAAVVALSGCLVIRQPATVTATAGCSSAISTASVRAVYPLHGANWLDYVRNNNGGTNLWNQTDQACEFPSIPAAGYLPQTCFHAGELRAVNFPGLSSCSGVTARDDLGVFQWTCTALSGVPTVVSRGFQPGKGLKDLIDSSGTSFLSNQVTINQTTSGTACAVARTSGSSAWWSNNFSVLPLNNNPAQTLSSLAQPAGTIFTVPVSTTTYGWNMDVTKSAIVTLGSAILTYAPAGPAKNVNLDGTLGIATDDAIIGLPYNRYFAWIEGHFSGYSGAGSKANQGVYFGYNGAASGQFARVHNALIETCSSYGLRLNSNTSDVLVTDSAFTGLTDGVNSGNRNIVVLNSLATNNSNAGFSGPMIGQNLIASNNATGFMPGNTTYLSMVTTANSQVNAVYIGAGTTPIYMVGGTAVNTSNTNFVSGGTSNKFSSLFIANNSGGGYGLTASGNSNDYYDLVVSNSSSYNIAMSGNTNTVYPPISTGPFGGAANCNITGVGNNIATNTCLVNGVTLPTSLASVSGTFVGPLFHQDSVNSSNDASGTWLFNAMTDWTNFSSPFRVWGRYDAIGFPDGGETGKCAAGGTCQIYDWRLLHTDTILRGAHGTFQPGPAACPASVDASVAANFVSNGGAGLDYLLNAAEIIGDAVGNENGLCQSNEECVFMPNIGGYQGEGDLYSQTPCVFNNGATIQNVVLYGYPINRGD